MVFLFFMVEKSVSICEICGLFLVAHSTALRFFVIQSCISLFLCDVFFIVTL